MPTPLEIHLTSDIAKAFITSEFLTDMKIDLKNLPLLTMRLQIQLNSHGMELDTEKFSELVNKDNDVGSVIKQCGELLYSSNADASGLVTLLPEYSKGSVDAARGEKPSLASKPKHETRNAVVRGVKNSLSMRGIVIDSDSDSIDSDYSDDEEAERLFGLSSDETEPKSRSKLQRADEKEVRAKAVSKFQAAAKNIRQEASYERSDLRQQEGTKPSKSSPQRTNASKKLKSAALNTMMFRTRGTKANEDADTASQESKTSRSIGSKDTGSKKKLGRNSTMDSYEEQNVIATPSRSSSGGDRHTRRTDTHSSEDSGIKSSRSSSRGKKPAKLMRSRTIDDAIVSAPGTRRTQEDEFSTGSSRMSRGEAKKKPSKLKRSKTVSDSSGSVGSHSSFGSKSRGRRMVNTSTGRARASSIGSQGSKGSSGRATTAKRQGSVSRSSRKGVEGELDRDSSSRRRRVREGSF